MQTIASATLLFALLAGVGPRSSAAPAPRPTASERASVAAALDRYAASFVPAPGPAPAFDLAGRELAVRLERGGERLRARGVEVRVRFDGASRGAIPRAVGRLAGTTNAFSGARDAWRTGLARYAGVRYDGLWPGVDLVYRADRKRLKYELVVAPGADARRAAFRVSGAESVRVDEGGRLVIAVGGTEVVDDAPYAFQPSPEGARPVACRYEVDRDARDGSFVVTFALGAHDPSKRLVVDPAMLVASGLVGGSGEEGIAAIATGADGDVYVVGATSSSQADGFPVANGFDTTFDPSGICAADPAAHNIYVSVLEVFVARVKADGSGLVFCTYLGGKCNQGGTGIAVDADGNVYVTGSTTSSPASGFPVTVGPSLDYKGGLLPGDGFVAKLSPDGASLLYCGYVGGEGADQPNAIAVDADGNAYVGGLTSSKHTFPATVGPQITTPDTTTYDGFVAKVKADGSGLAYCGYVAGAALDFVTGVAVDASGAAYVVGQSSSAGTLPTAVGPSLAYGGGISDAFVGKVKPDGSGFAYLGFVGGDAEDNADGVAVDARGNAYFAGETRSTEATFPVRVGPDLTFGSGPDTTADAFVAKVKPDGSGLVYCGYVGGALGDGASGIAVDASGRAAVAGATYSSEATFPVVDGPDLTFNGGDGTSDAFVAVVKADGSGLESCGYVGGEADDAATAVAFGRGGDVVVAGVTRSTEFPVAGALGPTFAGSVDAFVATISTGPPGPSIASVAKVGKKLVVTGANFGAGSTILVNGTAYKTKRDPAHPTTVLNSAKAGKVVMSGDAVRVRSADGRLSNAVAFSG